jgi:hypothetical protein
MNRPERPSSAVSLPIRPLKDAEAKVYRTARERLRAGVCFIELW